MQKQNTLSLCYNRMILMTAVVLCGLLSVFWCHLPVHAATKDANGHTVATDLSGVSYSLLTDDKTLYIFRTTDNVTVGSSYTYTKNGKSYSGKIESGDFEHSPFYIGGMDPVKVVFLDDVQPVNMSFSDGRNLIAVDGMKEHLDTRKVENWGGYLQAAEVLPH